VSELLRSVPLLFAEPDPIQLADTLLQPTATRTRKWRQNPVPLKRDGSKSNRHRDLAYCLRMIFSENRCPMRRLRADHDDMLPLSAIIEALNEVDSREIAEVAALHAIWHQRDDNVAPGR
jgi:hypothetical protein